MEVRKPLGEIPTHVLKAYSNNPSGMQRRISYEHGFDTEPSLEVKRELAYRGTPTFSDEIPEFPSNYSVVFESAVHAVQDDIALIQKSASKDGVLMGIGLRKLTKEVLRNKRVIQAVDSELNTQPQE